MTPNIVTAVTAAVCLLSLLTNANAGTTPWRRHQPSVSTFLNHSARARSVQKSLPIVLAPNRPPLQTTSSNPVIIHTTYNGHPINATVVRATPTPSINVNSTIRHDHGGTQFAEKPAAHHHTDMSIIPSYGNHTLFYTNRWKIANASAPFKQIHSTSAKKDGVHSCLKTCIQEANCAFAGFSQRGYSNSTMAIAAGKNVSLTTHLLNTTCSLYSTVVNGVGELVATHVNEKVSLGPEFLAVVGDRVAEEKLRRLLGDRVWWRSGEGRGASNGIFHGHDGRAVERDESSSAVFDTSTAMLNSLATLTASQHEGAVKRAESTTTFAVSEGVTATTSTTTSTISTPTESAQFDMRKRFFLRTRVTHGNSDFNNLYIRNPTTPGNEVSTPHLTSNRSIAALFTYSFSTSSINLCCASSNSSRGLSMIRDRDGDAYGSVVLAPQVGTVRMAMILRDCGLGDGVGVVQISARGIVGDEERERKEKERKEAEEKLNWRYSRLHPPPPLENPLRRNLHSLHIHNLATTTFLGESIEAVEPVCGTTGSSASLVWKNDRFGSWVVCRRFDRASVDLRWWDIINDRGIDEEGCAKVDLEGVGVADGEVAGLEGC